MIELLLADRCTGCNACVQVCPTRVFEAGPSTIPRIARQSSCQTCFMCELYCPEDALFVAPDCEHVTGVSESEIRASGWLGRYRRDSGWGEHRNDPAHANESWRMDEVFARARAMAKPTPQESPA